jgi:hypothetical protein
MITGIMTNREIILSFLLISATAVVAYSQEDDFGMWFGTDGKYEVVKNLDIVLSGSVRTFDNTSKIDQFFGEGGIRYIFNDFLTSGTSYRLIGKLENDSEYHPRHKFFLYVRGDLPVSNFTFSGRAMYQRMVRTYIENDNDLVAKHYARFKLKTSYSVSSSPIEPYIYIEPFMPLFDDSEATIKMTRFSAGMDIKISRMSSIEAEYIYENYTNAEVMGMHIISLNYNLRF